MGTHDKETKKRKKIRNGIYGIAAALFAVTLILMLMAMRWSSFGRRDGEPYSVYCIGDSITYGTGVADSRETDSYPALLEGLLGEEYTVYNCGVSGRTLLDNTAKSYKDTGYLELVKAESPDIIVVMLGTNDSKQQNWQPGEFKQQYTELVESLRGIESHPDIYVVTPPEAFAGADGTTAYGINNDVVQNEIRTIVVGVAEETGVNVIDMYSVTENHPEYFMDGVHPNKAGNQVLAEAVYEEIHRFRMP